MIWTRLLTLCSLLTLAQQQQMLVDGEVSVVPESIASFQYSQVSFTCSGRAPVSWLVDRLDNRYQISPAALSSTLVITSIAPSDAGRFNCSLVNGSVSVAAYLEVQAVLPFLNLSSPEEVGHYDDGVSHAILIPKGFPFGNILHQTIYVSTNGIISFSEPFYTSQTEMFPGVSALVTGSYLVAPFWSDVDLQKSGDIFYQTEAEDGPLLQQVNQFIGGGFQGNWVLVARWEDVHPHPHGSPFPPPETRRKNTFQAVVVTDGNSSHTVFSYKCDMLEWAEGSSIGFTAAGGLSDYHPAASNIACINSPISPWYNIYYQLAFPGSVSESEVVISEPAQKKYLMFLAEGGNTLSPCEYCNSEPIPLGAGTGGIPFGNYYHHSAYVSSRGFISFGSPITEAISPAIFPSGLLSINTGYIIAPYFSVTDTRLGGNVTWYNSSDPDLLSLVADFISSSNGSLEEPSWMLVATWTAVHPHPHGDSQGQDRQDPYLNSQNTFQAIIISNSTKTYSVFTYNCEGMEWSGEAVVGFNAAAELYRNHRLSGTLASHLVACVHHPDSPWNNVVHDLSPGSPAGMTPPPRTSVGSCSEASYTECCDPLLFQCVGEPHNDGDPCYCDALCVTYGDCCWDQPRICQDLIPDNTSFLLYTTNRYIGKLALDGSASEVLDLGARIISAALAIDYDYQREWLYWSDTKEIAIYRAHLKQSNTTVRLYDTNEHGRVVDIALDWVSNNLYMVETLHRRIVALDLTTLQATTVVVASANSAIEAIALDPVTRWMYWVDGGYPTAIERASMDGMSREVLHTAGLAQPGGITIDLHAQRIFWTDSYLLTIESSSTNGTGRVELFSLEYEPKRITMDASTLFWAETGRVQSGHRSGSGHVVTLLTLTAFPNGVKVVSPQPEGVNYCLDNPCQQICLLSAVADAGYSCACTDDYQLQDDAHNCSYVGAPAEPPEGSCLAAGFASCCAGGHCYGNPPTCLCDEGCHLIGDCCGDVDETCPDIGSCVAAGYDSCCQEGPCQGEYIHTECHCDESCHDFGDCCDDISSTCPGLVYCPPLPPLDNAIRSHDQPVALGSTASYTCLPGFSESGSSQYRCDRNGNSSVGVWSGSGFSCSDINECQDSPCHMICTNKPGSYNCSCRHGYRLGSNNRTCDDINECQDSPCDTICTNTPGSYNCSCRHGYQLGSDQSSCQDIDECSEDPPPCPANQLCLNTPGNYTCHCPSGTTLYNGTCSILVVVGGLSGGESFGIAFSVIVLLVAGGLIVGVALYWLHHKRLQGKLRFRGDKLAFNNPIVEEMYDKKPDKGEEEASENIYEKEAFEF